MTTTREQLELAVPDGWQLVVGILAQRLGGEVVVTQDDLDAVAYGRLEERFEVQSGKLVLTYVPPKLIG